MKSRSKFLVDEDTLIRLFEKAGIQNAGNIAPLGAGEFNAVYSADSGGRSYAIKIAPAGGSTSLSYEQGMMEQEVYYYPLMKEAGIRVPEIFHVDFSRKEIPADWFIMEKLPGRQLDHLSEGKETAELELAGMAALLHSVRGDRFGYRQTGLRDDWYSALHGMIELLIADCGKLGYRSPRGRKLLKYVVRNRRILEGVECRLINFDIWPPNIIVNGSGESRVLGWIDPERCLWGDRIADLVCLDFFNMTLDGKSEVLKAYNAAADTPIETGNEERIRLAIMTGYLGLIMEVEKYARYSLLHFGYWRNVMVCRKLFKACFGELLRLTG